MSLLLSSFEALLHVSLSEVQCHPCISADITQNVDMVLDFWDAGSPPYRDVKERQVSIEEFEG